MRQLSIIILLILMLTSVTVSSGTCAVNGYVDSSIPIYYDNLTEIELAEKAKKYYFLALQDKQGTVTPNITNALVLYTILQNKNPSEILYPIKLGVLYDKICKDRFAKSAFYHAIEIDKTNPEPYFYLGEYYYSRQFYRKALKNYNEAYSKGYEMNYELLFRMGDIYEKLGDTRSALVYLKKALLQNPNMELESKINRIETLDLTNKEFYSDTRIRVKN